MRDVAEATRLFRDDLGLALRFESPEWTEFATEGATLALHATGAGALARSEGDAPAGTCRVGFNVADPTAFHERMQKAGAGCLQEPTNLHGTLLAQYSGPDGLVFSVAEARA